ncbi:ATP-binding protein [Thioclava electrotropha]|uniref:histidine kinase n=2 Tax=Thioclava TaxID=285107 RepID=A0ABX6YZ82_9RHOB|nr:ATP-binding protein [Thioclava electrotropha]QPZ92579.1 histidine kinase [Thioclava electrotropha]
MARRFTPVRILIGTAVLCALIAALTVFVALAQPWMGLRLSAEPETGAEARAVMIRAIAPDGPASQVLPPSLVGAPLVALSGMPLVAFDMVEEPDVAEDFVAMRMFLDRQQKLNTLIRAPQVILETGGDDAARFTVVPRSSRPITSLPPVFWVQILSGMVSAMIGVWVLSLRRGQLPARLLAIAGGGVMLSAFAAALYSTRELALPGALFRWLGALNHAGALMFGVAMLSLLLVYPVRLVSMRLLWGLTVFFAGVWVVETARALPLGPAELFHLPAVLLMLAIVLAGIAQFVKTAGDPAARAAVRWFALSVGAGAGGFVLFILVPPLFSAEPVLSQGYAFALFALLFMGVAAGVARYQLFDLDRVTFRLVFYFGAVALLVMIDAVLIYVVSLSRPAAFALSLAAIAWIYLPLRERLAVWLTPKSRMPRDAIFNRIVDVALAPHELRQGKWQQVLRDCFEPLEIAIDTGSEQSHPRLVNEGVSLIIPGVSELDPLRLSYARTGRALFNLEDQRFATEIHTMLAHAISSRNAYSSGMQDERIRIARDLHDNLGAQLLSALHSKTDQRKDTLIRDTIADMRDIVKNAARGGLSIGDLLADLRLETSERLEFANIRLTWDTTCDDEAAFVASGAAHGFRSVLRELVSNALRHSKGRSLDVRLTYRNGTLRFTVRDDGVGLPAEAPDQGHGLANINARILALGGHIAFEDAAPGLKASGQLELLGEI